MKALKERILHDGKCFEGGILKVDNFINHQMDPILMKDMAEELTRRFANEKINKVLTIEASGIAPAILTGYLLKVPVVFAKHHGAHAYHHGLLVYQRPYIRSLRKQRLPLSGRQRAIYR